MEKDLVEIADQRSYLIGYSKTPDDGFAARIVHNKLKKYQRTFQCRPLE